MPEVTTRHVSTEILEPITATGTWTALRVPDKAFGAPDQKQMNVFHTKDTPGTYAREGSTHEGKQTSYHTKRKILFVNAYLSFFTIKLGKV